MSGKPATRRVARARALLRADRRALEAARRGRTPKGPLVDVVRVGAVLAAKEASRFVPLAHPIGLDAVSVGVRVGSDGVEITAEVVARARTGVEIEAMAAAFGGALTAYDMLKKIDRAMTVERVELLEKRGGRSGAWRRGERGASARRS